MQAHSLYVNHVATSSEKNYSFCWKITAVRKSVVDRLLYYLPVRIFNEVVILYSTEADLLGLRGVVVFLEYSHSRWGVINVSNMCSCATDIGMSNWEEEPFLLLHGEGFSPLGETGQRNGTRPARLLSS